MKKLVRLRLLHLTTMTAIMVFAYASPVAHGQDIESLQNEGQRLVDLKRYPEALLHYEAALDADPYLLSAICAIGLCYERMGDHQRAKDEYRRTLSLSNNSVVLSRKKASYIYSNRTMAYFLLKDYENALRQCSAALAADRSAFNYIYRALSLRELGRYQDALADLNSGIRTGNAALLDNCYEVRGDVYLALADYSHALDDYSQAKRAGMVESNYWQDVGDVYRYRGEYERAAESYEHAGGASTTDISFLRTVTRRLSLDVERGHGRAAALKAKSILEDQIDPVLSSEMQWVALYGAIGCLQGGDRHEATLLLDEVAAKCNHADWPFPIVSYLRGERSTEFVLEAAECFEERTQAQALIGLHRCLTGDVAGGLPNLEWVAKNGYRLSPEYPLARREFRILKDWTVDGVVKESSQSIAFGSHIRALRLLDHAIGKRPGNAAAHIQRALVQESLGNTNLALKDVDDAVKLGPKDAQALCSLGKLILSARTANDALPYLDKAISLDPKLADAHFFRGRALALLGQPKEAIAVLGKAIELGTTYRADAYERRGDCEMAVNEFNAAAKDYTLALSAGHAHPEQLACRCALSQQYLGDFHQALALYRMAIQFDPTCVIAYQGRVITLLCMGQDDLAMAEANAYVESFGKSFAGSEWMTVLSSLAARKLGDVAMAEMILREATAMGSAERWPNPIMRYLLHEIDAARLLTSATDEPMQSEALIVIGNDLMLSGDIENSRRCLESARTRGIALSPLVPLAIAAQRAIKSTKGED